MEAVAARSKLRLSFISFLLSARARARLPGLVTVITVAVAVAVAVAVLSRCCRGVESVDVC